MVARAARLTSSCSDLNPIDFIKQMVSEVEGEELRGHLQAAVNSLGKKMTPVEFAESRGWSRGVSGYVNQTVPAALYCWAYSPNDFRMCVENTVMLGGDTDSVAAISGAISGANLGYDKLPTDWIDSLAEWPRTTEWMKELAKSLDDAMDAAMDGSQYLKPPGMHWLKTIPRNILFATIVIGIGFRRLLPPY